MKAINQLVLALSMIITLSVAAQQGINYKALIKDGGGNVVASQTIDVRFTIIADTGPTNVYLETHTGVTTDANGIIILNIGEGSVNSGIYADIDWGNDVHSLKVEIDIEQDASFVDMGTTQFMAVPYALSAANAATKIDELSDGKSDGSSVFLGVDAGVNDDGTNNINIGIGTGALFTNTSGFANTAIGDAALVKNTMGYLNTAIGSGALFDNISGFANTAIGSSALQNKTSGSENTAIGNQALTDLTSGSNNIGVGYDAQPSTATVSNEVTVGNASNNVYRMYAASWTNASDRQLKHAIQNIPVGLDLVLKLRPVEFIYNNANNEQKSFGFIAQEVKEAVKHSNLEDNILVSPLNKKYLGLRTTELISVLTKAIQEQQEIIEEQNKNYEKLLKRVEQLELVVQQ